MIYITSDLHFGHNKDFIYEKRGFDSIEEHDREIVKRWNSVVKPKDEVYFLGDIGMGRSINHIVSCVSYLNGKINWIFGNHDSSSKIKTISSMPGIEALGYGAMLKYNKRRFYLSHYPTMSASFEYDYKNPTINLCGHVHTSNPFHDWNPYMIYHCELDAHNCYPISIDQIISDTDNMRELF